MQQDKRQRRRAKIKKTICGTAARPRLSVHRSLKTISAQLIDDENGVTLAAASDLKDGKGLKMERARSIGKAIAKKAIEKKITTCVFDRGGYKYHGRVKALAEGAREGGLQF